MSLVVSPGKWPGKKAGLAVLLFVLLFGLAGGCRHLPTTPEGINPEDYTPVSLDQLREPHRAGLAEGQRVRVDGFFWQYLEYDPFMAARYLAMARHPREQGSRRWAALYGSSQMRDYYDRLVLTWDQQQDMHLRRLEGVRVYGQLTSLGFGILYLQAHQVDRLAAADNLPARSTTAPRLKPGETPKP
jgi:hypothetical protein